MRFSSKGKRWALGGFPVVVALLAAWFVLGVPGERGCGGPAAIDTGRMELRLSCSSCQPKVSFVVTIRKVEAHLVSHGWITLAEKTMTLDLHALTTGAFLPLAAATLTSG